MIWYPIRAFAYGFVLFGGMLLITDLAFSTDLPNAPIWGTAQTLVLASAGGALFVFSWFCLFQVLLSAAALPVIAFNIHGLPQLQAFGIHWPVYSSLSALLHAYGWLLLHSALLLVLPSVIHRRYRRHFAPTGSPQASDVAA